MEAPDENAFLQVLRKAAAQQWCTTPFCTTCGAREFRLALRDAGGDLGGPLVSALTDLDVDVLTSLPGWDGALQIAVRDLPFPGQASSLLESWLVKADQNLRFFDLVLYKFVRHLPEGHPVRAKWLTKSIAIATHTHDFSIVESVILTLRNHSLGHNQLIDSDVLPEISSS
jgi:hypothetical protein